MIPALAIVGLLALVFYLLHSHAKERQTLLDRIQAPEQVIVQRTVGEAPDMPPAVHPDSDEEYWKAREEAKAAS